FGPTDAAMAEICQKPAPPWRSCFGSSSAETVLDLACSTERAVRLMPRSGADDGLPAAMADSESPASARKRPAATAIACPPKRTKQDDDSSDAPLAAKPQPKGKAKAKAKGQAPKPAKGKAMAAPVEPPADEERAAPKAKAKALLVAKSKAPTASKSMAAPPVELHPVKAEITAGELSELEKLKGMKVPKPVVAARDSLKKAGISKLEDLTADKLKDVLDDDSLKSLFSSLGTTLKSKCPMLHAKYVKDTTGRASIERKREWLTKFIIDPTSGGCSAGQDTTVGSRDESESLTEWLTEEQLGGPMYLNSPLHASIIVKSLDCRPHRNGLLAEAGVREYKFSKEILREIEFKNNSSSVSSSVDVNADTYKQIQGAMMGQAISSALPLSDGAAGESEKEKKDRERKERAAAKAEKEKQEAQQNPMKAKVDEAKKLLDEQIKKAKAWARSVDDELREIPGYQLKLQRKGFPQSMGDYLAEQGNQHRLSMEKFANGIYTEAKSVKGQSSNDPQVYTTMSDKLKHDLEQETTKFNTFKKSTLDEMRKMKDSS
ncbi:unnamed protein product, partial [Prorocentrum cordatum]